MTDKIKRSFFPAAVVSIPLYGCTTWTLTKRMEKKAWRQIHKNVATYIEKVMEAAPQKAAAGRSPTTHHETIKIRRTRFAVNCWRNRDELLRDVLQWTSSHGRAKVGWPARTYIKQLCADMRCSPEDLPKPIEDMLGWTERVRDICADCMTWWWWWWWW